MNFFDIYVYLFIESGIIDSENNYIFLIKNTFLGLHLLTLYV